MLRVVLVVCWLCVGCVLVVLVVCWLAVGWLLGHRTQDSAAKVPSHRMSEQPASTLHHGRRQEKGEEREECKAPAAETTHPRDHPP